MYGLNDDDIKEVETWYARRYPNWHSTMVEQTQKTNGGIKKNGRDERPFVSTGEMIE